MAEFTAQDVRELRERTGVGMMDCKKALVEADGDMEKAIALLREKGLAAATKKAGRIAAEGIVTTYVDKVAKVGVVLEVNAETDFVAKNQDFVNFVGDIALTIAKENPADVEALKAMKLDGSDETIEAALQDKILVIGENMVIRRFERYEGAVGCYTHANKRIGVLVGYETDESVMSNDAFHTMALNIGMQIAASNAGYINREDVPADLVAAEEEILKSQALNEGKPEKVVEMMVKGRIDKFYRDITLVDQAYVKDGDITVKEYIDNAAKEIGSAIKVAKFVRYELGEGIERKSEDFADEVASMLGGK